MLIMKQHDQFLFPFYFEWGRDHSCKTRIDRTKEQQNKEKRYICRYIHTHTKKVRDASVSQNEQIHIQGRQKLKQNNIFWYMR